MSATIDNLNTVLTVCSPFEIENLAESQLPTTDPDANVSPANQKIWLWM